MRLSPIVIGGRHVGRQSRRICFASPKSIEDAVLKAIETQSVKDKLREVTAEAYERGVRGVPTIAVGDELFWGDDRLEEAASALAGRSLM